MLGCGEAELMLKQRVSHGRIKSYLLQFMESLETTKHIKEKKSVQGLSCKLEQVVRERSQGILSYIRFITVIPKLQSSTGRLR